MICFWLFEIFCVIENLQVCLVTLGCMLAFCVFRICTILNMRYCYIWSFLSQLLIYIAGNATNTSIEPKRVEHNFQKLLFCIFVSTLRFLLQQCFLQNCANPTCWRKTHTLIPKMTSPSQRLGYSNQLNNC